jgi:hypothetical protein
LSPGVLTVIEFCQPARESKAAGGKRG